VKTLKDFPDIFPAQLVLLLLFYKSWRFEQVHNATVTKQLQHQTTLKATQNYCKSYNNNYKRNLDKHIKVTWLLFFRH